MGFSQRHTLIGTLISLAAVATYIAIVIARATTDGAPLTAVAWQAPLLWCVGGGAAIYVVVYAVTRAQFRGERVRDERTARIETQAEFAASGLTGIGVLAALIMLALDVDTFWAAHVLLLLPWLGSLLGAATTLAAYREGIHS